MPNEAPEILSEVSESEWVGAGPGWTHLPYYARFAADRLPPDWATFLRGRYCAVLESGRAGSLTIALPEAPRALVFLPDGRLVAHTAAGAHEETPERPLEYLRRWSRETRSPRLSGGPVFQGGLISVLGYELAGQFEPVPLARPDPVVPIAVLLEAAEFCVFDAERRELIVVILCPVGRAPFASLLRDARRRALVMARAWHDSGAGAAREIPAAETPPRVLASSFDEEGYVSAVRRCREYIAAGDTYQVNLSVRLEVPAADPLLAYEAMRQANPSPYMGFVRMPGCALACGSPELLVAASGEVVASRPIAGTRPRGDDAAADAAWAGELAGDSKEKAEHLMLVDLLRNDVGRVSTPGTVAVPEFMAVERYSHVMHLVSQVEGRRARSATTADIVRAFFPGGTITGAPKVRTMQIIAELEPVARGFYTGSLGWIGASGDLCLNIIIRSLWTAAGRCFVQAGAGVVADSDPAREYAESLRKAQAALLAASRARLR